jgi:hypothetical protein
MLVVDDVSWEWFDGGSWPGQAAWLVAAPTYTKVLEMAFNKKKGIGQCWGAGGAEIFVPKPMIQLQLHKGKFVPTNMVKIWIIYVSNEHKKFITFTPKKDELDQAWKTNYGRLKGRVLREWGGLLIASIGR